jgi:hypothetical protein
MTGAFQNGFRDAIFYAGRNFYQLQVFLSKFIYC